MNYLFDKVLNTPFDYTSMVSASSKSIMRVGNISCNSQNISTGTTFQNISNTSLSVYIFDYDSTLGKCSIVSTSASDSTNGTGIRTVLLNGLDTNFKEISEVLVLNGTTPVQSVLNFQRINSTVALQYGNTKASVGTITCSSVNVSTSIHFIILPLKTNSNINRFCCPAGHTAIFKNVVYSAGLSDELLVALYLHSPALPLQNFSETMVNACTVSIDTGIPQAITEKTSIIYTARSISGNTRKVSVATAMYIIKNEYIL